MKGLNTAASSVELTFAAGSTTEVRNYFVQPPSGVWIGGDGAAQPLALHNCFTEAIWFFPTLGVLAQTNDPQLSFLYLGAQTYSGVPVLHLRTYRTLTNQDSDVITLVQTLSTEDVYLDPASLLPEFLTFFTHPDNNFSIAIPVEIDYADYRPIAKALVPYHIRRFESGVLKLDLVVGSAALNSGLSPAAFTIPQ